MNNSASSHSTQAGWCLRFTSGPMRGRNIGLRLGANIIGSASGCDVVLPGPEVQPRHLQFNVGEVAVALQRLGDASVRLNGVELEFARRSVVVGDRIALGRIEFEIDRVYASEEAADSMFLTADAAREAAPPVAHAPPARRLVQAWPVFAAVFLMSALMLWWTMGTPNDDSALAPPTDFAQLRKDLAAFPEVELVAAAGGRMQVNGFVESQVRRQALDKLVQPYGKHVVSRVQVVEAVMEQARRFIGDPGVAVSYGGKGRLVVTGATDSAAVQDKVHRLAEDMHPAVLVSDKVQYRPPKQEASASEPGTLWTHWQSVLPARVVSITEDADGMRHIQLANGDRYYEGAMLKSGAELKLITPDELVVMPQRARP